MLAAIRYPCALVSMASRVVWPVTCAHCARAPPPTSAYYCSTFPSTPRTRQASRYHSFIHSFMNQQRILNARARARVCVCVCVCVCHQSDHYCWPVRWLSTDLSQAPSRQGTKTAPLRGCILPPRLPLPRRTLLDRHHHAFPAIAHEGRARLPHPSTDRVSANVRPLLPSGHRNADAAE